MIYVPDSKNYKCFVVRSEEVIRAYEEIPKYNTDIVYRDYYFNANYYYNDGVQSFSQYSTLPVCLSSDTVTDIVFYRTDFDSILLIFFIMCIFCFYLPLNVFMRFCRRIR